MLINHGDIYNLWNEFRVVSVDDVDVYKADPQEFVWMIKNCEGVLTDSFHATVFSILFHKKCVFERKECEKRMMWAVGLRHCWGVLEWKHWVIILIIRQIRQ